MTEKGSNASVLEEVGTIPGQKLPEPGSHERMLAERALLRKLDRRLLPTIFVIFIMNYIDVCASFFFLLQSCGGLLLWMESAQCSDVGTA